MMRKDTVSKACVDAIIPPQHIAGFQGTNWLYGVDVIFLHLKKGEEDHL